MYDPFLNLYAYFYGKSLRPTEAPMHEIKYDNDVLELDVPKSFSMLYSSDIKRCILGGGEMCLLRVYCHYYFQDHEKMKRLKKLPSPKNSNKRNINQFQIQRNLAAHRQTSHRNANGSFQHYNIIQLHRGRQAISDRTAWSASQQQPMSQTNHRRCNRGNTTTNKRVASTPVSSTISRTTYLLPPFLLLSFLGVSHASELLDRSAPAFVAAAAAATATATAATTTTAPSIVGHNSAPSAAAAATAAATAVGSTHGSRRPFHLSASTKPQLSLPAVDEQSHEAACVPPPTTTTAAGGNKKDGDNSSIITAFKKDFTQPMGIPEEGIEAAVAVMRTGRLFRYSCANAETSQVAQAEREFAESVGARFAVGVNSCSSAILVALLGVGVRPGDEVLTNAFTFTAVPCAVLRLGAEPVLVECSARYVEESVLKKLYDKIVHIAFIQYRCQLSVHAS